jgi:uncharacterized membrane protein YcaP (DUF421 family)
MPLLADIDWREMWLPTGSLLAIVIRGSVMYLGLVVLFRVLRRDAGSLSLADLLLVVLIADASQNGLAGGYQSLTEGIVLVATIAGWSYALDWLCFRFKAFERLLQPPPLMLVRDGVMLLRNMRRELITADELRSQMRQHGIARIEDVLSCYLEPDGQISMVSRESTTGRPPEAAGR